MSLTLGLGQVLIVCAHTDDEFGCAGTIARLIDQGATIHYIALSRCEESVPVGMDSDILERECRLCTRTLGIDAELTSVESFPVRHFPRFRQEILELLVDANRRIQPHLVFLPSSFDTHQDHRTVYEEGFRAFKKSTILGYELPQNLISFSNSAFIELSMEHLARKLAALAEYRSQSFRPYAGAEFIRGLATVRGVQCGAAFAEAFELVRLIDRI